MQKRRSIILYNYFISRPFSTVLEHCPRDLWWRSRCCPQLSPTSPEPATDGGGLHSHPPLPPPSPPPYLVVVAGSPPTPASSRVKQFLLFLPPFLLPLICLMLCLNELKLDIWRVFDNGSLWILSLKLVLLIDCDLVSFFFFGGF